MLIKAISILFLIHISNISFGQIGLSNFESIIDSSVYAIVSISKSSLSNLKLENDTFTKVNLTNGLNGTCFFVTATEFITAHHVFNTENLKSNYYFLINNAGRVIYDVTIEKEVPSLDLTIGRIKDCESSYLSISHDINLFNGDSLISFGFPQNKNKLIEIVLKKENGKVTIVNHSKLVFENIRCSFVITKKIDSINSTDSLPVKIRNADVFIIDTSFARGMSGGPVIEIKTLKVIGFNSMHVIGKNDFDFDKKYQLVIPICNK